MIPVFSMNIFGALLVFIRIFSMLLFAPIFGNDAIPIRLQVIISILFTMVIYPIVSETLRVPFSLDLLMLALLVGKEAMLGIIFGFAATIVMSIMRYTGDFLGRLIGFHEGNIVDPFFQDDVGFVGHFYSILFMLLFLSLNGHHFIIQIIAKSFSIAAVGDVTITGPLVQKISSMIGDIFLFGIKFSAPILAFIIITTVAFGILGKAIPEMNLLIMMLPAKILIGLVGIIVIFPFVFVIMKQLITGLYRDLELILHLV
ncbi:flagellar biosynthetic protein FliR [bacterium]|nr:flagellar biosynthetic protein FliR [bacterium]MCP5463120.1 flagellar biosynthetic protein FliR [bacterium]